MHEHEEFRSKWNNSLKLAKSWKSNSAGSITCFNSFIKIEQFYFKVNSLKYLTKIWNMDMVWILAFIYLVCFIRDVAYCFSSFIYYMFWITCSVHHANYWGKIFFLKPWHGISCLSFNDIWLHDYSYQVSKRFKNQFKKYVHLSGRYSPFL